MTSHDALSGILPSRNSWLSLSLTAAVLSLDFVLPLLCTPCQPSHLGPHGCNIVRLIASRVCYTFCFARPSMATDKQSPPAPICLLPRSCRRLFDSSGPVTPSVYYLPLPPPIRSNCSNSLPLSPSLFHITSIFDASPILRTPPSCSLSPLCWRRLTHSVTTIHLIRLEKHVSHPTSDTRYALASEGL